MGMGAVGLIALALFDIVICVIEIPKMRKQHLVRELFAFVILLLLGTVGGAMKSFNLKVPNPYDFLMWVYSPLAELMKSLVKA